MRIVPAFLIAPIPAVIVQTITVFSKDAGMGSDWRAPLLPLTALLLLWAVQLLIGVPMIWVMRRRSWIGVSSFAIGGAVMVMFAASPFWIRMVMIESEWVRRIHRFPLGMAIDLLSGIARLALCGAITGVFFYWLTRGRHSSGEDLDALRQRFE